MDVRQIQSADLDVYRSLRLAALASDPGSFGSSLQREQQFDDETWANRLASFAGRPGAIFVCEALGEPVGMVGIGETEEAGVAMLWGMWVRPDMRRTGAARGLLVATIDWSRAEGLNTIELAVFTHNTNAGALYRSSGFTQHTDQSDDNDEIIMSLAL